MGRDGKWKVTPAQCLFVKSVDFNNSQCMRFPTMWYVRPAKAQISLRICAV